MADDHRTFVIMTRPGVYLSGCECAWESLPYANHGRAQREANAHLLQAELEQVESPWVNEEREAGDGR